MDNLDAMFEDMLGELDVISQQLNDTDTTRKSNTEAKVAKHSPTVIPVAPDVVIDADLDAMLSDLTDWENNLAAPSSSSGSKVSVGDDYQQGSGDLHSAHSSEMLHATYGMDVSPQFNTLKRSAGGGPTVTYDDADLTLENLAKDIEVDKRKQDKARQLSAEELATLSPVMQDLDDLVNDLANMGFVTTPEPNLPSPSRGTSAKTTATSTNNFDFSRQTSVRTVSQTSDRIVPTAKKPSVSDNIVAANIRRNSAKETPKVERLSGDINRSARRPSLEELRKNKPVALNKPKPPPKPPVSSKPQLPRKPLDVPPPRPAKPKPPTPPPLKRQQSAKAPENLSSILERQLQRRASQNQNDRRSSRTSTSSEPAYDPVPEHGHADSAARHAIPNSSPHHVPISKHSSVTSVVSSLSAGSAASGRSDSSSTGSSGPPDRLRYSAEIPNEKHDDIRNMLHTLQGCAKDKDLTPEEREERIRNEKMRIALEKLKEARIQKLVVKVFNKDDSSKTLLVDERMTARGVIAQLLEKNHFESSVNWALVEELPSLYMERIFEEHESVTEMLAYWTRDTTNQVRFLERKDKYALFRNPQHYLLSVSESEKQLAERQKLTLIEEFFSGRTGTGVPEVQGVLYIKTESKSWAKKYCVLRSSGLYISKSGEPKKGKKLADLHCMVMFEQVCVYLGRGWKKKYKSPTDYGFALKHPAIQTKSKHIRYFCCDDVRSLMRWIVGIRCAKYGKQLKDNYDKTESEVKASGMTAPIMTGQREDSSHPEPSDVPRPSISNMFGGAWQRANQGETQSTPAPDTNKTKSVWNSGATKSTSSNWWDLGPAPELKELANRDSTGPVKPGTRAVSDLPPPPPASAKPAPPLKPHPHANHTFPPPDDLPPPPMDDMPPPPPMDDLPPPPPMDDDMPLPPPMPLATGQGQLPVLPMFKNTNNNGQRPPRRPGPPPPPSRNSNASNNKPPSHPQMNSRVSPDQDRVSPPRPPMTAYYTNAIKGGPVQYAARDLPPAPQFVNDLKDTFHGVSRGMSNGAVDFDDFPPPPPELLLNEVKSRKDQRDTRKKSVKSAPPPPRRSGSTRLSFKRA